jgi:hypothetical protein
MKHEIGLWIVECDIHFRMCIPCARASMKRFLRDYLLTVLHFLG